MREVKTVNELQAVEREAGPKKIVIVVTSADWCEPCNKFHSSFDANSEQNKSIIYLHCKPDANMYLLDNIQYDKKAIPHFTIRLNRMNLALFSGADKLPEKIVEAKKKLSALEAEEAAMDAAMHAQKQSQGAKNEGPNAGKPPPQN